MLLLEQIDTQPWEIWGLDQLAESPRRKWVVEQV